MTESNIKDLLVRVKVEKLNIKIKTYKLIKGYIGKPIGFVELLFHRGFINIDLKVKLLNRIKDLKITSNIPNFKNEKSEDEMSMNKRNIKIILTLKANCEISGHRIEYILRISKVIFQKDNSKLETSKRMITLNN